MKLIKRIAIIALVIITGIGIGITFPKCSTKAEEKIIETIPTVENFSPKKYNLKIYVIDSCEYIGIFGNGGSETYVITHKGNCKFCKQRKK